MFTFDTITDTEFDTFIEGYYPKFFAQSTQMGNLQKLRQRKYDFVGLKEDGILVGAALIIYTKVRFGYFLADIHRGICTDYNREDYLLEFKKGLQRFLKKRKCIYMEMSPYIARNHRDMNGEVIEDGFCNDNIVESLKKVGFQHTGFTKGMGSVKDPRWIYCLDVKGKTKEEIQQGFTKRQLKKQIGALERKGVEVRSFQKDEMEVFHEMMIHTAERQGFVTRDLQYHLDFYDSFHDVCEYRIVEIHTQKYFEHCNKRKQEIAEKMDVLRKDIEEHPEHVKSIRKLEILQDELQVEENNIKEIESLQEEFGKVIPISAGVFLLYGDEVLHLFGASYDSFFKYYPTLALQWDMISQACERGFQRYNFYGISGYFKKDEDGYGLYDFKRGFGGYVEELIGDFSLICSPMYHIYKLLKRS